MRVREREGERERGEDRLTGGHRQKSDRRQGEREKGRERETEDRERERRE